MPLIRYRPYDITAFYRPVDPHGVPCGPWSHLKVDLKRHSDRVAQCLFLVPAEDTTTSKVVEVKICWDTGLEPAHLMSECKDLGTDRVVYAPSRVYTNTSRGVHDRINPANPRSNHDDQAIMVVALHKRAGADASEEAHAALLDRLGHGQKLEFLTRVYEEEEEEEVVLSRSFCQPKGNFRGGGGGCAGSVVGGRRKSDVQTSGTIRGRLTNEVALQIFCHFRFEGDDAAAEAKDIPKWCGGVHLDEERHRILEDMRAEDSSD